MRERGECVVDVRLAASAYERTRYIVVLQHPRKGKLHHRCARPFRERPQLCYEGEVSVVEIFAGVSGDQFEAPAPGRRYTGRILAGQESRAERAVHHWRDP